MLETRVNILYSIKSEQVESPFESLILHLRLREINVVSDGRTLVWKGSKIEGINIFLENHSDLQRAVETIKDFFATRIHHLQLRSWQSDGREIKVIIKGVVNYNEHPVPKSSLEYIIE